MIVKRNVVERNFLYRKAIIKKSILYMKGTMHSGRWEHLRKNFYIGKTYIQKEFKIRKE